jgi:hypothetical protein
MKPGSLHTPTNQIPGSSNYNDVVEKRILGFRLKKN